MTGRVRLIACNVIVLFFSLATPHAWSQTKPASAICEAKDARENFSCSIEGAHMLCTMQAALAQQTSDWKPVQECKRQYQPAVRKSYDAALARLKGKPAAQAEAKAVYAEWIAATEGLMPKSEETTGGYRARTAALDDALKRKLASFRIEAGIE